MINNIFKLFSQSSISYVIQPKKGVSKTHIELLWISEKNFKGQISGSMAATSKFPELLLIISPKCGTQSYI